MLNQKISFLTLGGCQRLTNVLHNSRILYVTGKRPTLKPNRSQKIVGKKVSIYYINQSGFNSKYTYNLVEYQRREFLV